MKAGTGTVTKIKITPIVQGTGPVVKKGQTLTANYVVATYKDGKVARLVVVARHRRSAPRSASARSSRAGTTASPARRSAAACRSTCRPPRPTAPQQGDLRFIVDLLAAQ